MIIVFQTKTGRMAIPLNRISLIYESYPVSSEDAVEERRNEIVEDTSPQTYVAVDDVEGAYEVLGTLEDNLTAYAAVAVANENEVIEFVRIGA